jgi:hypothetical protein
MCRPAPLNLPVTLFEFLSQPFQPLAVTLSISVLKKTRVTAMGGTDAAGMFHKDIPHKLGLLILQTVVDTARFPI